MTCGAASVYVSQWDQNTQAYFNQVCCQVGTSQTEIASTTALTSTALATTTALVITSVTSTAITTTAASQNASARSAELDASLSSQVSGLLPPCFLLSCLA